jgi:hypothetical protein
MYYRALESEKDMTRHEQLHMKPLTCVCVSKHGEYIVTGSEDMSVRLWQLQRQTKHQPRQLLLMEVFVAHEGSISCLDICTEYHIILSGSKDHSVIVWDYQQHMMIRRLSHHLGQVLSVSMNTISGNIVTITKHQLRIYHINGDLIVYFNFYDPHQDIRMPSGLIALAIPCGDWQGEAVVAVTGHREGYIYLWKLQDASLTNKAFIGGRDDGIQALSLTQQHRSISSDTNNTSVDFSSSQQTATNSSLSLTSSLKAGAVAADRVYDPAWQPLSPNRCIRSLVIASIPTKIHRGDITCLRLCPSITIKSKDGIQKTYEESRNLDLFVGDADGFVSRWTPVKLEALKPADIAAIYQLTMNNK